VQAPGAAFTTLSSSLTNGSNKRVLQCYIALNLQRKNILEFWDHLLVKTKLKCCECFPGYNHYVDLKKYSSRLSDKLECLLLLDTSNLVCYLRVRMVATKCVSQLDLASAWNTNIILVLLVN
jgi:hypothetical protein